MQQDILDFAVRSLVPDGRLAMWMPTASDEIAEFPVPMHPNLEVVNVSVQHFSSCKLLFNLSVLLLCAVLIVYRGSSTDYLSPSSRGEGL